MSIADDATYTAWDRDIVECGNCGKSNAVDIWQDTRTLRWGFTLDCIFCGEHEVIEESAGDRGVVQVLFAVIAAGAAVFVIGAIGAFGGHWGQAWLMLAGFWIAAVPIIIAFFMGAKQGETRADQ